MSAARNLSRLDAGLGGFATTFSRLRSGLIGAAFAPDATRLGDDDASRVESTAAIWASGAPVLEEPRARLCIESDVEVR